MPSGLDFIELLPRRDPPTRIIVISGFGSKEEVLGTLDLNVFAWIEKGRESFFEKLDQSIERAAWERPNLKNTANCEYFFATQRKTKWPSVPFT
jgi:DNA-binding NarL/FixJ family response regulator